MMLTDLIQLIYQAMQPTMTVWGFTFNMWQVFVFSIMAGVFVWIWRTFINW